MTSLTLKPKRGLRLGVRYRDLTGEIVDDDARRTSEPFTTLVHDIYAHDPGSKRAASPHPVSAWLAPVPA
jgi:hypothetical protein